jgi:RNA polymerase sigma-70 factor (ECF subfamily)
VTEAVHTDLAVARRILAGDKDAFRSMFDRFFPRLYRFAIARLDGDHEAARDVVQLTFCRGIEHLDGYRGEAATFLDVAAVESLPLVPSLGVVWRF